MNIKQGKRGGKIFTTEKPRLICLLTIIVHVQGLQYLVNKKSSEVGSS